VGREHRAGAHAAGAGCSVRRRDGAHALPSQTPTWLECVCAVHGYHDASRLYRSADGRRLVLPLVRHTVLGRISIADSLPHGWGPGGLLGEGGVLRPGDVQMVMSDLAERPGLGIRLRPDAATASIWEAGVPARVPREWRMAQALSLDGGFDQVWRRRFRGDTRTRIRRAQRAGVVVERDDTGRLVPVFQQLYAKSVARWARHEGAPLAVARWRARRREPDRKLNVVASRLGGRCRIYGAFVDGRPAAAIVVLRGNGTAAYWRGAMDEEVAGPTYANYLLHSTAIEDAADAGCTAYHMGDSAPGSPLALFKSRFGAVDQHYASYRIESVPLTPLLSRTRETARRVLQLRSRRT
jgi:hypothetical protein